jgi:hypothetical protein
MPKEPLSSLTAELNWPYAQVTYPRLTAVIGDEQAWRELMLLLSAIEDRLERHLQAD